MNHFDILTATENGAIAAASQVGRGNKIEADRLATIAVREKLESIPFRAFVAVGEGIKDNSYGILTGETIGSGGPEYDLAIDVIEGTSPTANGGYEAMSVIALGDRNSLFTSEIFYMNKIASKFDVDITDPIPIIARKVCLISGKQANEITFCILDRPRHEAIISEIRSLGGRIKLIQDCDVSGAIAACQENSGIDVYMGIGGTPEGVLGAAAIKCMGGNFQGILCEKDGKPIDNKVYKVDDLVKGDVIFCATGITLGSLLEGVKYVDGKIKTHSLIMDSCSGTISYVHSFRRKL